jgi:agmatine/peptidylarginine deiminase
MEQKYLSIHFPAEWETQSGIMLTWPHVRTDWNGMLDQVVPCFVLIAKEIIKREKLVLVCSSTEEVKKALGKVDFSRIIFREIASNDTWARDHGPVSVFVGGTPYILDFTFNGWGLKFPANHDNRITIQLYDSVAFSSETNYQSMVHVVLEGGSIESDGKGTLLTTSECLLSVNRNEYKLRAEIEDYLQLILGVKRILWLNNGYLSGDDTDSHIDTLARFCSDDTIAYVRCTDEQDEHFEALALMEKELKSFKTLNGNPYRLIPLPMAEPVYSEGERLPATYANFLILNGAVLVPFYNSPLDAVAQKILQSVFPNRDIVGINCVPLIKQHGSLHCVTMQLPEGFL